MNEDEQPRPEMPIPKEMALPARREIELDTVGGAKAFRFLTDHNVPDSVGEVLINLGQDVVRLRDVMAADAKDPVVARAAIEDGRILISWDRDFNQQRFKTPRFTDLSRLSMSGPEMDGAARLEAVFDIVMFALRRAGGTPITIMVGVGKVQILV